jgi:hypothetical protein
MSRGDDIYGVEDSDAARGARRAGPQGRSKFTCPHCQQSIDVDSPVCPMCGSNLRNVKRPPAAQPLGISSSAAAPATTAGLETIEARMPGGKLISAIVVGAAVNGLTIWGIRFSTNRSVVSSAQNRSRSTLPQDLAVERQIEEECGAEARKWLENEFHEVQGLSRKQALFRVDEIYRLGANQVIAFGGRISRTLAIELPIDPSRRKQIFDWSNKWNVEHGFQAEKDVGQKWIVIGTRM